MEIVKTSVDEVVGQFLDSEFDAYAEKCGMTCGYEDFCFVAREDGKILGVITGHSYYHEVHIADLVVSPEARGRGIGASLVRSVEAEFTDERWENINLTTYGFQAPEFYKKLGYEVEYIRESSDERLRKFFMIKRLR